MPLLFGILTSAYIHYAETECLELNTNDQALMYRANLTIHVLHAFYWCFIGNLIFMTHYNVAVPASLLSAVSVVLQGTCRLRRLTILMIWWSSGIIDGSVTSTLNCRFVTIGWAETSWYLEYGCGASIVIRRCRPLTYPYHIYTGTSYEYGLPVSPLFVWYGECRLLALK